MPVNNLLGIFVDEDLNVLDSFYDGVDDGIILITDNKELWDRIDPRENE